MKYIQIKPCFIAGIAIALTVLSSLNNPSCAATPSDIETPAEATVKLYSKISARDLDGVMQLIPPEGFNEIGVGANVVHRIDKQALGVFFKSDLTINLRAIDVAAQEFGDTTIVTGTRVGSIAPNGVQAKEDRHQFTMVWTKTNNRWLLRHDIPL